MRLDGPRRSNSSRDGSLVVRGDSEEGSVSEEYSGSGERSNSEEHSNSKKPSNAPLSFEPNKVSHLELSIHEICHHRLGPALWTYHRDSDKPDIDDLLMPLRSPTDILDNTFNKNCIGQVNLLAMIYEAGLLDLADLGANFACSLDRRIFCVRLSDKEGFAMLHYSSADTGFNLVTLLPTPSTKSTSRFHISFVPPAFSADGSKFAVVAMDGTVSVWDLRNKLPLMVKELYTDLHDVGSLQFSSGTYGREVLAFTEHEYHRDDIMLIRLIDSTSFEIEETLDLALTSNSNRTPFEWSNVFFDPDGEMMYVEHNGSLYEWKLRAREESPEWWLGEG